MSQVDWLGRATNGSGPWRIGQLIIHRLKGASTGVIFDVRHEIDTERGGLRRLSRIADVLDLVREDDKGHFRPVRGMPDLPSGWRVEVTRLEVLAEVIEAVYPLSLAYLSRETPVVTSWEKTTERQSGRLAGLREFPASKRTPLVRRICHDRCCRDALWAGISRHAVSSGDRWPVLCAEACPYLLEQALENHQTSAT